MATKTLRTLAGLGNLILWRGAAVARRRLQTLTAIAEGVPPPRWKEPGGVAHAPLRLDLSGRVALVTGATGELGRVIARTLSGCGAAVAVHYVRQSARAETLERELRAAGGRAMRVQADVRDAASVEAMKTAVGQGLGPPDIVVVNAVEQCGWTSVLAQPVEDFEAQFRSSAVQAVLLAKAFAPAMIARRWGRIVGISTECAVHAEPNQGAYAAGKRGMDGVLRVLAKEIGPEGVTVNQVAPGWMISERDRLAGTERQSRYEARVPLRRRGEDADIAAAVAFLASDLAGFVTGAYLPVSGGTVMPTI